MDEDERISFYVSLVEPRESNLKPEVNPILWKITKLVVVFVLSANAET